MSLESKAKTTEQIIYDTTLWRELAWDCNDDGTLMSDDKWVSSKDVEKLEQSRDFFKEKWEIAMDQLMEYNVTYEGVVQENNKLCLKILEAQGILKGALFGLLSLPEKLLRRIKRGFGDMSGVDFAIILILACSVSVIVFFVLDWCLERNEGYSQW